jgi:molybdate transport system substrate-binding protein
MKTSFALVALSLFSVALAAGSDALTVVTSGGTYPAWGRLASLFTQHTGINVITEQGASLGTTPTAIPNRLARGEDLDVVIMVDSSLQSLIAAGKIDNTTRAVLAKSPIAAAVAGTDTFRPDVSTVQGLTNALKSAIKVAWSDSASGVYLSTKLWPKLNVTDLMAQKGFQVNGTPVGLELVANPPRAQLGFQQKAELMNVSGVAIVGTIPEEVQSYTIYSTAVVGTSTKKEQAVKLVAFLQSKYSFVALNETGLIPSFSSTGATSGGAAKCPDASV